MHHEKVQRRLALSADQPDLIGAERLALRTGHPAYRYSKLSEWVFDLLYRALLNFGHWVTALATGIKCGYGCFHGLRDQFATERQTRPPVFVLDEGPETTLADLETQSVIHVR